MRAAFNPDVVRWKNFFTRDGGMFPFHEPAGRNVWGPVDYRTGN